jgi:hypothetical protein
MTFRSRLISTAIKTRVHHSQKREVLLKTTDLVAAVLVGGGALSPSAPPVRTVPSVDLNRLRAAGSRSRESRSDFSADTSPTCAPRHLRAPPRWALEVVDRCRTTDGETETRDGFDVTRLVPTPHNRTL